MKEAIGTSFVFNLIMIFVSVFIILYVGALAYSKGFKVKNRIINIIETNGGYNETSSTKIDENLAAIGYQMTDSVCKDRDGATIIDVDSSYNYCLYQYTTNKGYYYGVTVFLKIQIPLIGKYVQVPIYGETRILFDKGVIEG